MVGASGQEQLGNVKEAILVCQSPPGTLYYSVVYQNVQRSSGSRLICE